MRRADWVAYRTSVLVRNDDESLRSDTTPAGVGPISFARTEAMCTQEP